MTQQITGIFRNLSLHFYPNPLKGSAAAFLWGPRQVGKTTFLHQCFPDAKYYDLLETDLSASLSVRPYLLREEVLAQRPQLVIIDEVQNVPRLLEEVHWLLENTATQWILCGSSARKLKKHARNLLGGRAVEFFLHPFNTQELPQFNLDKALNDGLLPVHYLSPNPQALLRSYINTYIKEEIIDESLTRNVPAFHRFLEVVSLTHGQQLNYANMARESGVSAQTVRHYYEILKDTLLGYELLPWAKTRKRRLVETAKFYLFDTGITNALRPESNPIASGSNLYGLAFEQFLLNEIRCYLAYQQKQVRMTYWRTHSGFEVDLILGEMDFAIEFKSTIQLQNNDFKGLRAIAEEFSPKRRLLVSRVPEPRRRDDGIEIIPWHMFCEQLWAGEFI